MVSSSEEPQRTDTSALLDLVRQYGSQRYLQGAAAPLDSRDHGQRAEALFARIEELVFKRGGRG